jgi:ComF family protein
MRRWFGLGLDLVYPPVCAYCLEAMEPGSLASLCPACRAAVVETRPACPRCGALARAGGQQHDCPSCNHRRFHFDRVWRLGIYHSALRSAVLRMKRPTGHPLAVALGDLLAELAGSRLAALQVDVVVPVPMHWTRKAWRGTNSAEAIARRLAGHLRLPMRPGLLKRCRRTAPQASLPRSRRRANVRGAFRARNHADLPGARILLVDDIMTSGATVNEAAKTLRHCGARFVGVAVLARAEGLD